LKVCPNCNYINQDTDEYCGRCHYNMLRVRPQTKEEKEAQKKRQNRKYVIIFAVVIVAIVLVALFVPMKGGYTLPQWMIERMQHGKAGVTLAMPYLPGLGRLF
jgi:uncharacterized membrane protein YvbJ